MVMGVLGKNGCRIKSLRPLLTVLQPPTLSLRRRCLTAPMIHHRRRSSLQCACRCMFLPWKGMSSSSLSLSELHEDAPEEYIGTGEGVRDGKGVFDAVE